ncbi:MAG: Eco57I restriction-modification methylase domain-containing protein [Methanobrevibacter sp. CfCl-M3]
MIKNTLLRLSNAYKKYGKNIKIRHNHKEALNQWYKKYEAKELDNEMKNYPWFQKIILEELLGYKLEVDFKFAYSLDSRNVEFMIILDGEPYIPIELKGSDVNLDSPYHGGLSPVEQASNYANKRESIKWFIVSNYYEFRLYNQKSQDKYIQFNLDDLRDENTLKDFLLCFSKQSILEEDIISKLYDSRGLFATDYNLENEFYKLYSQTRLMLIKELEYSNDIGRDEAISYAQLIMNRYIFICFAEDKDLLPDNTSSMDILTPIKNHNLRRGEIWHRLNGLFIDLFDGNPEKGITDYNGGLFREDLTHLRIRDKTESEFYDDIKISYNFPEQTHIIMGELKQYPLINKIYRNLLIISSFDFDSDIDVNILGHIFENSINDIEELKQENVNKRKKDGVYYTPETITTYICENTIIPYLSKADNKTIDSLIKEHEDDLSELEDKLRDIKLVDPACGSGAFLNKAIDTLLEIYRAIHKKRQYQNNLDETFSNIDNRRKILLNNIYGVDINKESIEITKLGLFLKVAQKGVKLPNLDKNIVCGNSLIDDPEYTNQPFDWTYPLDQTFSKGLFDIVIGNPPYVRQEKIKEFKPYFKEHYETYTGVADLYVYFFEKGLSILKNGGSLGFICSNKWTRANYGKKLRKYLLNYNIIHYNDYTGEKVFDDTTVDPSVIIINKTQDEDNKIAVNNNSFCMEQSRLGEDSWSFEPPEILNLKDKIMGQGTLLKDIEDVNIFYGIKTGYNDAFIINEETKKELINKDPKNSEIIKPLLRGRDIGRWSINYQNLYLIVTKNGVDVPGEYLTIYEYLKQYEDKLTKRYDQGEYWYNLRNCAYYEEFEKPKIIWSEMVSQPSFTKDLNNYFLLNTSYTLTINDNNLNLNYLVALFNSKLLYWYLTKISYSLGTKGIRYIKQYVEQLPIILASKEEQKPFIDLTNEIIAKNKELQSEIQSFHKYLKRDFNVTKINKNLMEYYNLSFEGLYKEIKKQHKGISRKEADKLEKEFLESVNIIKPLQNEIAIIDKDIDKLVYDLYNLTNDEVSIIEK